MVTVPEVSDRGQRLDQAIRTVAVGVDAGQPQAFLDLGAIGLGFRVAHVLGVDRYADHLAIGVADLGKLKELTQRVFDAQEDERRRVARELHDGISQILVGVKYALDITKRRLAQEDPRAMDTLERGHEALTGAIQEVRRISRDLRPGVLDDLGLGPALKALIDDFEARTGIETTLETVVFRNRVDQEGRIALYRIAQEALTNIERHSGATEVTLDLRGHRRGATLRIEDNGHGIDPDKVRGQRGIGLRNMQERMDQLGGHLRILSSRSGTVIEAQIPLSHLLPPEDGASTSRPKASA